MNELVLYTYDWVPEPPRGYVRDLRVRWALEEAALPYRVASTPFENRGAEHFAHQPFGQVPWLTDGDLSLFESGAILLHLGEWSDRLLPREARRRSEAVQWFVAALNSLEMVSVPWSVFTFSGDTGESPGWKAIDGWLGMRLRHLDAVLAKREWLAGEFSIADIVMSDALRLLHRFERLKDVSACREYVARATARPAFAKSLEDQLAHFAAADASRTAAS
jgi:glutathione S-transferase